ncbi:hypothetical protein SAMN05444359_1502 [Neolewinella agarilytica]|uniref:Uncharacterized protein n=1 Tax=Neolewinella agarilytica TaxID=478744 RepID=A0A1H9PHL2_9BACT|nr:hypothetical protein SAMN05444359_1502 [Neolewinella agarilytica]
MKPIIRTMIKGVKSKLTQTYPNLPKLRVGIKDIGWYQETLEELFSKKSRY